MRVVLHPGARQGVPQHDRLIVAHVDWARTSRETAASGDDKPARIAIVEPSWQVYRQSIEVFGLSETVLFVSQTSRKRRSTFGACGRTHRTAQPDMTTTPWYLEIVHVSNREKQQDLLTLLHEIASVTALGSSSGSDHYVVFECPDRRLKGAIEKLFGELDPAAERTFQSDRPLGESGDGGAA